MRHAVLAAALYAVVPACADETSLRAGHFATADGRQCDVRCGGGDCTFECSFPPTPARVCPVGSGPTYTLVSALPGGPRHTVLCDGCGDERASAFQPEECIAVVCMEADDCPYRRDRCESGVCTHESTAATAGDAAVEY
jgi:hypothetical protein